MIAPPRGRRQRDAGLELVQRRPGVKMGIARGMQILSLCSEGRGLQLESLTLISLTITYDNGGRWDLRVFDDVGFGIYWVAGSLHCVAGSLNMEPCKGGRKS